MVELAGFGPIAAAHRTATLLERLRPRRVLLVGIAGSYDLGALPIGSATTFDTVQLDGVGSMKGHGNPPLALEGETGILLTVCTAAEDLDQASARRERFQALAEDMEAYGVALACHAASTPLTVVRGISNRAGDRDTAHWRVDEALDAALELATR